jgi:16S rRNA (guanine1516-N2)-methyltransferase
LGTLHLDFLQSSDYTRKAHRGKSELIAKAVGLSKGRQKVFDATLGLAQDAWFLNQLGAEVEGCERSPIVYLLLAEALLRSGVQGFNIHFGDSQAWIRERSEDCSVIYIDPMFPEKKKSALPRKEMRIFRKWVGEDGDAHNLLQVAMASGVRRVVVKRPLRAPPLLPDPVHRFEGQTVRYDLYSPLGREQSWS